MVGYVLLVDVGVDMLVVASAGVGVVVVSGTVVSFGY